MTVFDEILNGVEHRFLSAENGSLRDHSLDTCELKLTEFKIGDQFHYI